MSIKRRVEKLEQASPSAGNGKYTLMRTPHFPHPRAKDGETLLDAVERSAQDIGLTLDQVGFALVEFPDGHVEEFQSVPDPWNLHGLLRHEEALQEMGIIDKSKKLFPGEGELRLTPEGFMTIVNDWKRLIAIIQKNRNRAVATGESA